MKAKQPLAKTLVVTFGLLAACHASIPPEALQLSNESLQTRQLQSRRFDTTDERKLLIASSNLLQDLGFSLDESETKLGLVVGSKDRDATEAGQVAGAIIMAVVLGARMPVDTKQKIRASVVTHPAGKSETVVRVTFQRIVWNDHNQVSKIEGLTDVSMYQQFFDKLSQSVFLTANNI
ncbi:Lipoprotein [Azospirillaceae bacterium]